MPSSHSFNFSISKVFQIALSITMGALFWPAICKAFGAFGEPGALHDLAVTTSLISGAVGGCIGWAVAWTFTTQRRQAAQMVPAKVASEQPSLHRAQG